jgi:hypothetical protein
LLRPRAGRRKKRDARHCSVPPLEREALSLLLSFNLSYYSREKQDIESPLGLALVLEAELAHREDDAILVRAFMNHRHNDPRRTRKGLAS